MLGKLWLHHPLPCNAAWRGGCFCCVHLNVFAGNKNLHFADGQMSHLPYISLEVNSFYFVGGIHFLGCLFNLGCLPGIPKDTLAKLLPPPER